MTTSNVKNCKANNYKRLEDGSVIISFKLPPDDSANHRVDRVLSFFSRRANWDPPTPSPAGDCVPPPFGSGDGDTLACGG